MQIQPTKWIRLGEGRYKLVPADDPRPEDTTFAKRRVTLGVPYIITKPGWVSLSERLMPDPQKMDSEAEVAATDAMLVERAKEVATSAHAKSWEEGRRQEWRANKKYFLKDRAEKKERHIKQIVDSLT